jgi:hypothetical protein
MSADARDPEARKSEAARKGIPADDARADGRKPKSGKGQGLRVARVDLPLAHHLPTDTCQTAPDLALVNAAWDRLPAAVKAGIVAMVMDAAGVVP